MNRKIYKQLAKKYGVTVEEIKRDMQEAINAAYVSPNDAALGIKSKGTVPTIDEFITQTANKINADLKQEDEAKRLDSLVDEPLRQRIMNVLAVSGNTIFAESGSLDGFKSKSSDELSEYHFGLGLYLRNNVLTDGSDIFLMFREVGITERDDMSSVMIRLWHTELQGQK